MGEFGPTITNQTKMEQNEGRYSVQRKINPIQLNTGHLFPFSI